MTGTEMTWSLYLEQEISPGDNSMEDVEGYLLDIDGETVAGDWLCEYERTRFLNESFVIDMEGDEPIREELDPSQCHFNVARFWMYHHDQEVETGSENPYTIMTGYGLGPDDDIWRSHSWLQNEVGEVIETTLPRRVYVGVRLVDTVEAKSFCHGEDVYSVC